MPRGLQPVKPPIGGGHSQNMGSDFTLHSTSSYTNYLGNALPPQKNCKKNKSFTLVRVEEEEDKGDN